MARDFAKKFYKSKEWRGTAKNDFKDGVRYQIMDKYNFSCGKCGEVGEEVHHIIWLTPENINDPYIALGEDNLILLCKTCHANEHRKHTDINTGFKFNENGDYVPIK